MGFSCAVENVVLYSIADGVLYDGVPETHMERSHTNVTVIFCALFTCGVVFVISCMLFNFIYRNKKFHNIDELFLSLLFWRRLSLSSTTDDVVAGDVAMASSPELIFQTC